MEYLHANWCILDRCPHEKYNSRSRERRGKSTFNCTDVIDTSRRIRSRRFMIHPWRNDFSASDEYKSPLAGHAKYWKIYRRFSRKRHCSFRSRPILFFSPFSLGFRFSLSSRPRWKRIRGPIDYPGNTMGWNSRPEVLMESCGREGFIVTNDRVNWRGSQLHKYHPRRPRDSRCRVCWILNMPRGY